MNIYLGSLLAAIGLTIPFMLAAGHLMGTRIYVGLEKFHLMICRQR